MRANGMQSNLESRLEKLDDTTDEWYAFKHWGRLGRETATDFDTQDQHT